MTSWRTKLLPPLLAALCLWIASRVFVRENRRQVGRHFSLDPDAFLIRREAAVLQRGVDDPGDRHGPHPVGAKSGLDPREVEHARDHFGKAPAFALDHRSVATDLTILRDDAVREVLTRRPDRRQGRVELVRHCRDEVDLLARQALRPPGGDDQHGDAAGEHREDTEADGEVAPPRPRDGGVQGASAMDGDETPGARREPVFAADAPAPGRTRRSPLEAGRRIDRPFQVADDPGGERLRQAERIADRKHLLPDPQVRGGGHLDRFEAVLRGRIEDLDDGEVVVRKASVSEISPLQIGEERARQVGHVQSRDQETAGGSRLVPRPGRSSAPLAQDERGDRPVDRIRKTTPPFEAGAVRFGLRVLQPEANGFERRRPGDGGESSRSRIETGEDDLARGRPFRAIEVGDERQRPRTHEAVVFPRDRVLRVVRCRGPETRDDVADLAIEVGGEAGCRCGQVRPGPVALGLRDLAEPAVLHRRQNRQQDREDAGCGEREPRVRRRKCHAGRVYSSPRAGASELPRIYSVYRFLSFL